MTSVDNQEDINSVEEFYKEILVLPEMSGVQDKIPAALFRLIESSISQQTWKILKQIVKQMLIVEHEASSRVIVELIPSLIWSHIKALLTKQTIIRCSIEKIILNIYNNKILKNAIPVLITKEKDETIISEKLELGAPLNVSPNDIGLDDSNIGHLSKKLRFYNSKILNVTQTIYGLNILPPSLKNIPLGYSLDIYSYLLHLVCIFSKNLTQNCLFATFRLVHRLSRTGYEANIFSTLNPSLPNENIDFMVENCLVRIPLSNYLVERLCYLLLRSIYVGYTEQARKCSDDLYIVASKQNLFTASASILALIKIIDFYIKDSSDQFNETLILNPLKVVKN